ncbi:MAG: endonuclease, partial [Burkholderiales bacterium]|nr:endonuclease [Burkholderiales bacterium]
SSIDSMQRALNSALIQAKSAADAQAHIWRTNAAWFTQEAREHRLLFADMGSLLGKPHEDFQAIVKARIAQAAELAAQKAEQQAAESAEKAVWFNIAKAAQQDAARAEERAEERARNADRATLTLGDMNERLTPLKLTADAAAELGIVHLATNKAAKLYSESQFSQLCDAIVQLVMEARKAEQ